MCKFEFDLIDALTVLVDFSAVPLINDPFSDHLTSTLPDAVLLTSAPDIKATYVDRWIPSVLDFAPHANAVLGLTENDCMHC